MATASAPLSSTQPGAPGPPKKKSRRRKTAHLKIVPETKVLRQQIREKCYRVAAQLDKSRPLSKEEMEVIVRGLLDEIGLPEGYVGWTMVIMTSAFWHDQVAAIPPSQRLFLLPHCLKHAEGCPADYDEFGLDCKQCGACSIADFRAVAEEMGYKVLVAEGSPIVLKIIVSGYVDAIIGVACLNVLEKAIDTSIVFAPTAEEAARIAIVDDEPVSALLRGGVVALGITNIRVIKKIERLAHRLAGYLQPYRPEVLTQAVTACLLSGWAVFERDHAPPMEFIQSYNALIAAMQDRDNDPTDEIVRWRDQLSALPFSHPDDFDRTIFEGVSAGYFDEARLLKEAKILEEALNRNSRDNNNSVS